MPHHPSEEEAPSNLTDKIAQHSSDSNASDHPIHDENKGPIQEEKGNESKAKEAFNVLGGKGPQVPDKDLPAAKSRDELDAETKKLNNE